jgi:two-component system chemotaxis sensor kinase CheA
MDLSKYRQLFLDESREHLQVMNRELLRLEQEGETGGVDALFRAAHSVKGMAGSMGYEAVVAVSHALEDVLDRLRKQTLGTSAGLMALLYEGADALGALIGEIEADGATRLEVAGIAARLREAARQEAAAPAPPPPVTPAPPTVAGDTADAAETAVVSVESLLPDEEPAPTAPAEPIAAAAAAPAEEAAPAPEPSAPLEPAAPSIPPAAPDARFDLADAFAVEEGPAPAPAPALAAAAAAAPPPVPAALERPATEGAVPPEPSREDAGADLVAARGGIFSLEPEKLAMVRDFVRSGLLPYACQLRVSKDSAALCARNFVILGKLAKAGMVLASNPTVEEVRAGAGRELIEALLLTERPEEQLRAQLLAIPELEELQLRRLRIGSGERAEGAGQPGTGAPTLLAPRQATVDRPAGTVFGLADRYAPKKAATVRVDTRVLDDLINIVGEMLITRERLQEIGRDLESEELHLNLDRLRVLVRTFQDTIMTVRMMPLALVTDRLPRIVRDLAHQSEKQIGFDVQGQNIELDRAILEELNDVLIHLVRNAIDHGIEPAERRSAVGKPAKATVRVRAGRERDWVWIRVEDDGRGMDPERIARAAVARGLVSAERAATMEPREKLLLCCLPGVSTAESITDISGRGVGMDVVKSRVDSFGGALQIDSQPGRGTAVTLRLPLTLAIIRILLVQVRGQEFGLPVSHVLRTAQMDPNEIEWSQQQPLLRLGTRLVPLHDLGALVGLPPRDLRSHPGLFLAVSEFGERAAGLAVDRLLGTYEVVIKPLGPPLKRVRGLAGVTVMGDGRTVLLLDLAALI